MAYGEPCPGQDREHPVDFWVKHRGDLLAYAATLIGDWAEAQDAVSHAAMRMLEHYARLEALCPSGRDPLAWSKTVILNYHRDRLRRAKTARSRAGLLASDVVEDVSNEVLDRIIAGQALEFVATLDEQEQTIAVLRWVEGMEPREIARKLRMNPRSVRSSLHRTRKKLRRHLGVAEPQKILRERTA